MTLKTSLKQFSSTYRHRCGMGIGAGCISGIGAIGTASIAGGTSHIGDFGDASGCGGCGGCGGYAQKCFLF